MFDGLRGLRERRRWVGEENRGGCCMHHLISSHLFLSLPSFSRVSLHTLWYFHVSSLCLQIQLVLPSYVLSIYKFMRWIREANYTLIIPTHLHLLSLLSAHLSDFFYKRRSPHFRPSLRFRPQAVSLPAPSAPHTLTCIPAYTIEKHAKKLIMDNLYSIPPSPSHHRLSSTGDPKRVIYRSGNPNPFYANRLIYEPFSTRSS